MAEVKHQFAYVAIDPAGKRTRGELAAASEAAAFATLRADGLTPVSIKSIAGRSAPRAAASATQESRGPKARALNERTVAELLSNLAALLRAGADIRSALSILGSKSSQKPIQTFCKALSNDISGGMALDLALSGQLSRKQQFVAALAASGQATGDLAGAIDRAADIMTTRIKLRDQLVSALSYPAFVFASAVAALVVILIFIVPALAPLAEDNGATPPLALALMIATSNALRAHLAGIGMVIGLAITAIVASARFGLLTSPIDRFVMQGPAAKTASSLVYGGFAIALGVMLSAGTPMTDALRLATRTVRSIHARTMLQVLAQTVREGRSLSDALQQISGMPGAIPRLTAVGEAAGALGAMLTRAGELEEREAIRKIEKAGQLLGPLLIVLLGGMIGLLMAGLLSGVSQLGDAALR